MKVSPRFSIVIPTRNRADTLRFALATCLNQKFDDYEVVVCDNSDDQSSKDVVEAANSPFVRYLAPGQPLAMSANWERGVREARGEYVTVLGDDDGLMPYALRELNAIVQRSNPKAIQWSRGIYTWPSIGIPGEQDLLRIPLARSLIEVDGRAQIAKVMRFETGPDSLPMIYCSVIHRDLIELHRKRTGRVFLNVYPDVYSAFGFGYLAGSYLSTTVPMNIAGLSHASNGVATLMNEDINAVATDFEKLNAQFGYVAHPRVPRRMILGPVHVVDCFLHAKDALFPEDNSLDVDRKAVTVRYLGAISDTDPGVRKAVRKTIRESLADDRELLEWFDDHAPHLPPAAPFSFRPNRLGYDGYMLSVDASAVNVTQIAEAVDFAASLLGFDAREIEYDVPVLHEVGVLCSKASQRVLELERVVVGREEEALAATLKIDALQQACAALEQKLGEAHGAIGQISLQLSEAQRTGSLRYVPRRLLRKMLMSLRRLPGTK